MGAKQAVAGKADGAVTVRKKSCKLLNRLLKAFPLERSLALLANRGAGSTASASARGQIVHLVSCARSNVPTSVSARLLLRRLTI
jgi:hypothetical protein